MDNNQYNTKKIVIAQILIICAFSVVLIGTSFAYFGAQTSITNLKSNVSIPSFSSCNKTFLFNTTECQLHIDAEDMYKNAASGVTPINSSTCVATVTINGCAGDYVNYSINITNKVQESITEYCTNSTSCKYPIGGSMISRGFNLSQTGCNGGKCFEYSGSLSASSGVTILNNLDQETQMDSITSYSKIAQGTLTVSQTNQAVTQTITINTKFYNTPNSAVSANSSKNYFSGELGDQAWLQQYSDTATVYNHKINVNIEDQDWSH